MILPDVFGMTDVPGCVKRRKNACWGMYVLGGVLAALCPASTHANKQATEDTSAVAVDLRPPPLPPGGRYLPMGRNLRVQGQHVSAWIFDVPAALPDVAAWLTEHQSALRDLWVLPGFVVLAGVAGSTQWAARLYDAGGGRTRGTLSALPLRPRVLHDRTAKAWRLHDGELLFELESSAAGETVIEQLWTHGLPPAGLRKWLSRELPRSGWRLLVGPEQLASAAALTWSRGNQRLTVVIAPLDKGSGVTVILSTQAPGR